MSSRDQMFVKVVLASKPTNGAPPIITMHWRYPRIIHGEVMTHRVFSRNARSSRAVPVATMLREIDDTPFVPWHWGKNQKGMQASEECDALVGYSIGGVFEEISREDAWLQARNEAVRAARNFSEAGYHKQIVNRLIEPFSWIDTLITSTSWANFFHLRDHKDAEPHFRDLAQMVKEAIIAANFRPISPGEWHLPYIDAATRENVLKYTTAGHFAHRKQIRLSETAYHTALKAVCIARCARISYAPFDGDASIEKELDRYDLLVGSDPLHASPAEHQATPDELDLYRAGEGFFKNEHLAGNLGPGWIQFRKTLPGEYVADR